MTWRSQRGPPAATSQSEASVAPGHLPSLVDGMISGPFKRGHRVCQGFSGGPGPGRWWWGCEVEHSWGGAGGRGLPPASDNKADSQSSPFLALQGLPRAPLQRLQEGGRAPPGGSGGWHPDPTPGSFSGICPPTDPSPFTAIDSWTWGAERVTLFYR